MSADPMEAVSRALSDVGLPRELPAWRGRHAGETIVVCGCGRSLNDLPDPRRGVTIGVNDVGRLFDPTYLVVLNPPSQFAGDRFRHVQESRARALFTQLDDRQLGARHPCLVRFRLGRRGGTDVSAPDSLPYTRNSPYVAVCLAAFMGARRIGLIGVDLTDHHFFADTGRHSLSRELAGIDREYGALAAALARRGVELVNLSRQSRLNSLRKVEPAAFLEVPPAAPQEQPLDVVSYATTPVAGVPAILARCIAARTPHRARCVWADRGYGNGVTFDGDIEWQSSPREADAVLAAADVVIVHNGKVAPRHEALLAQKPVVTLAHNYMWNVDSRFVSSGFPGLVVGQYQATLPEFAGWSAVPNPLPFWEAAFAPETKPNLPVICYTPSGKHERYPAGHRLYWHAKGYETTMRVLDGLARRFQLQLEVVRKGQLSHAESLAMKRRAHVVIDECVTGSYHRNSLEGLAAGCVVVNGVGLLPGVVDAFKACTPGSERMPYVFSRLEDLEPTLTGLVLRGAPALEADGRANREWMERHWDFGTQWALFWQPAVTAALDRRHGSTVSSRPSGRSSVRLVRRKAPTVTVAPEGVSVVIPHGGAERLPHLTATLISLRQRAAVREIIIAEMGDAPTARDVAGRWADKYVFIQNGGEFERARTLNVGSGVAESPLVLWSDNDLLTGPHFIERAARELRDRRLDYLVPYSSVRYLSDPDSRLVMHGGRDPSQCRPTSELYSGRRRPACSGGTGLVSRDFLLRYGGFIEGFRGWGGEDNAWNRKVGLLGRSGATGRPDQPAYHLFHAVSGGYRGHVSAAANNPHYARNLALLGRVCAIREAARFLREFPPPPHRPCPWDATRPIALLADGADAGGAASIAQALGALYGARVEEVVLSANDGWSERCESSDALLVLGTTAAARVSGEGSPRLLGRSLVVLEAGGDVSSATPAGDGRWLPAVHLDRGASDDATAAAVALAGPLSLVLAGAAPLAAEPVTIRVEPEAGTVVREPHPLPVWAYWEGPCPAWIEECRRTIAAHAPGARLLTPESFAGLRDRDHDIDLTRLLVVHRADFIRAFVLARYGGLWIDSDCLVMQPLRPLLDRIQEHDFVAHRERSGLVSNGFIGARPGSRIAALYYDRLCRILRSRRALGWTSLGSQPLNEVLAAAGVPWLELPCESIQPICWSNPAAFFARGSRPVHEARFDVRALCYMLSNTEVRRHMAAGDSGDLMEPDTFFRFLLDTALANRPADEAGDPLKAVFAGFVASYRGFGDESLSGPGSCLAQTIELRERLPLLLESMGVRSLVDAPCGDFNWMAGVRLGLDEYVGVDILEELVAENRRRHGGARRRFLCLDIRRDPLPGADCILSRDLLVHLSFADAFRTLQNFKRSGARYLLTTTFTGERENRDTSQGQWRTLNLERPPFDFPAPMRILDERCTEAGGTYRDKSLALWPLEHLPLA